VKYIVAVSGGVDSVVLLDRLVKESGHELIVAHFDHGIRPESDADARFVEGLAKIYGLSYEVRREVLGPDTSELKARHRRYEFLRSLARKYEAVIATAHHQDDLIETIAINLVRGTGWRGLAVLGAKDINRPLLEYSKADIYEYALKYGLEWVEDETNASDKYLRNRLRRHIHRQLSAGDKTKLVDLWQQQRKLCESIDNEVQSVLSGQVQYSRYFFTHIDEQSAMELLRTILGFAITRPQAVRAIHAIKTALPGTTMEVGAGYKLRFSKREVIVETP
jgi:tRNA(Ile)-lysidine synthase